MSGKSERKIVKVFSLQTLAEFAEKDESVRPEVVEKIRKTMRGGTPAVVKRGTGLLDRLQKQK